MLTGLSLSLGCHHLPRARLLATVLNILYLKSLMRKRRKEKEIQMGEEERTGTISHRTEREMAPLPSTGNLVVVNAGRQLDGGLQSHRRQAVDVCVRECVHGLERKDLT